MQLTDLTWPAVQSLNRDLPVVFPVAALEQHGPHLPLFTDSLLLGEIIRRTAAAYPREVLFAPLLWLGNSDHHLDFPGTLSAPPRAYLDLLGGLMDNFIRHGFRRLVFVNGHGGNDVPGQQAIFETRQKHRQRDDLLLLFATYWRLDEAGPLDPDPGLAFQQRAMGHACEWETSMILRLAPQLAGNFQELPTVDTGNAFAPASRGWTTRDRSEPGYLGAPRHATPEKGEVLFQHFSDRLAALLAKVIQWDGKRWA